MIRDEVSIKLGEQKQLVLQADCPKIKYLEHALITLTLEAPNRGQLEIAIKSPKGNAFLEFRILSKNISR